MMPFNPDLAVAMDYLTTASDFRFVVAGDKATGWHPKVRGTDPENGQEVSVAFYEIDYPTKAEATTRARALLRWARERRTALDRAPLDRAADLGRAAFARGLPAASCRDAEFCAMLEGLKVGEGLALLKAWSRGWTAANLAAPVEA
jgi:hypothetical protein